MTSEKKSDIKLLTPKDTVKELDRFIIGQSDAKKSVAIALRNRYRRKQIESTLRDEIVPKNILMMGPTGVGKTEIARRLAKLANSPFVKVEATKFTEVGYVGKDVDSIIRDLIENAVKKIKKRAKEENLEKAKELAVMRVVDLLVGEKEPEDSRRRMKFRLQDGLLDENTITIDVQDKGTGIGGGMNMSGGIQIGIIGVGDALGKMVGPSKRKTKKIKIKDAIELFTAEENENLLDEEKIMKEAVEITENEGIVFVDEIDKVTVRESSRQGGSVSREGVQRDLLPLVEGTSVDTKYGVVKTDYILFIASGAFHATKVSDLLPELQGRFPIRVQLQPLTEKDFVKILTEPEASLIKQYQALMEVENVKIDFTKEGIAEIAKLATKVNLEVENIGARRLHTLVEKILEEVSFKAPEMKGQKISINKKYVDNHIGDLNDKIDLSKFIL
jgi:ATP-dependent HslUV protease ATP-binding subunit HslU